MNVSKKQYDKMVKKASPPSPKIKNFILAYTIGGLICVIGQLFKELYVYLGLSEEVVKMLVPVRNKICKISIQTANRITKMRNL